MIRNRLNEILEECAMAYIDNAGNEVSQEEFYGNGDDTDDESYDEGIEDNPEEEDDDEDYYSDDETDEEPDEDDEEVEEAEEKVSEPKEQFVEFNGKRYTAKEIEALEKGSLMQNDYTRKTQELANQRKQFAQELSLIEEIKNNTGLQGVINEYYSKNPNANKQVKLSPEMEAIRNLQTQMQFNSNEAMLTKLRAKDSVFDNDIYEAEVVQIALDEGVSIDRAYRMWKGDNIDKYTANPAKIKKEARKEITDEIRKNKGKTRTLVKQGDKSVNANKVKLSEVQMKTKSIYGGLFKSDEDLLKYSDPNYNPLDK